jgi:ferrochelatase
MSTPTKQPTGIVLMTYGSATTSRDVSTFLHHVYPNPSQELITEFERRFDVVGKSPLIDITMMQASALQISLNQAAPGNFLVEAGFLHSEPFIEDAVGKLHSNGAGKVLGLLLSPQYSPHIMRGYDQALEQAARQHGYTTDQYAMAGPWSAEPKFIELISNRLRDSRAELLARHGHLPPVVFTTHSLPEAVVKRDPSYLDQLEETIQGVVAAAGLKEGEWHAAYQSAGHTPEEWLKPDLNDVIADLHTQDVHTVVIVPIQFLADHLETLYDLDVAAREETETGGVHYYRLAAPNTDPLFIAALSDIVSRL